MDNKSIDTSTSEEMCFSGLLNIPPAITDNTGRCTIEQLLPYLLINYNYIEDVSLMNGKMGGVIFFSIYAKKSGVEYYGDYIEPLLDDIYEEVNSDSPVSFERGLCGIGWGIEFLIRNGYIEGDSDEILEDIDTKVMEHDPRRITDFSFGTGLGGILFYVVWRLKSFDRGNATRLPFDQNYLDFLSEAVNRDIFPAMDNIPSGLVGEFNDIMRGKKVDYNTLPVIPEYMFYDLPTTFDKDLTKTPIGINKGLTGIALKLIMQ